jgi:hypothetical protein
MMLDQNLDLAQQVEKISLQIFDTDII